MKNTVCVEPREILFTFVLTLLICVGVAQAQKAAAVPAENVVVTNVKLTDSDGYWYGSQFTLTSTSAFNVCVFPYVVAGSANVVGSVVPMIPLKPFEKNVNIGEYKTADDSKPWKVIVRAKWRKGDCADK